VIVDVMMIFRLCVFFMIFLVLCWWLRLMLLFGLFDWGVLLSWLR